MKNIMITLLIAILLVCVNCGTGSSRLSSKPGKDISVASKIISDAYQGKNPGSGSINAFVSNIKLNGRSISFTGTGVVIDGNRIAITSAGAYSISGTLEDGQIIVRTEDKEAVNLILNGANINCSTGAPIYIDKAKETVITLADGTENYITDGVTYISADSESDEPNAAIFSKDNLTIEGNGSLTVNARYFNGIAGKDDLIINGGKIFINAKNDAIRGRDSVLIGGGTITVNAGADGIQSNNDEDPEKGYINIQQGNLTIAAGEDGIQAETDVVINGGNIKIASKDDAIHSVSTIEINSGDIRISECYEGIESAKITINGGNIHLVSSDDGMNIISVNGGSQFGPPGGQPNFPAPTPSQGQQGTPGSPLNAPMPGTPPQGLQPGQQNMFPGMSGIQETGDNILTINGGYVYVDALGDGVDINGSIKMTGGTFIINGPTRNDNGAVDYDRSFEMTGGFLVGVGSSGMAQAPGSTSTQYSVLLNLEASQPAKSLIHIADKDGKDVLTFIPTKTYQSVVLCSPELKNGSAYTVYTGGSSTGSAIDGLYSGGVYTPGTQVSTFTISSITTMVGSSRGGFPGGPGGTMGPPGGFRQR